MQAANKSNATSAPLKPHAVAKVQLNSSQLQQLAEWNALDSELVAFGETLLQLDVSLHAAVEAMTSPVPLRQRSAAARGACSTAAECDEALDRLLEDGMLLAGTKVLTAEAAAAARSASSGTQRLQHLAWNAQAATWARRRLQHASEAKCGWVGL